MPRRHTVIAKKFRLQCPDCATSRVQRFVNNKIGVVCACGNVLGTPRCLTCNAPGHHPHQLNSGRWACVPCKTTFTYPRGRKTKTRRAKFTTPKKSSRPIPRPISRMSSVKHGFNLEKLVLLAETLFQQNRKSSVVGVPNAKFVNFESNLLASPIIVSEWSFIPKTDALVHQFETISIKDHESDSEVTSDLSGNSVDDNDQDSSDENGCGSCEEMISESFTNHLNESYSDSYSDGMYDTSDFDIEPVASCHTSYRL